MIPLRQIIGSRFQLALQEAPASEYIPYACHWDDETILTKGGQMLQILALDGLPFDTASDDDLTKEKEFRNTLFKAMAGPDYALWFHIVRLRRPDYPEGDFEPGFADYLDRTWRAKSSGRAAFANRVYISILRRGPTGKIGGLASLIHRLSHRQDAERQRAYLSAGAQELSAMSRRFENGFASYGARVLRRYETPIGVFSEPLRFLSQLINLEDHAVQVPQSSLDRALCAKRPIFGQEALELRGMTSRKVAATISVKHYGPESWAGILDPLLNLPFEFVLTQSFVFGSQQEMLSRIQTQKRRLEQVAHLSPSEIAELEEALDDLSSGKIAFGDHHLTVLPIGNTLKDLEHHVAAVDTELFKRGMVGVREDLNLEACFWAQLPGNFDYIARRATISTANLASFASLHNYPLGKATGNHWGPAVTLFETPSRTPYFFNFHRADVGHTLVIGPTGTGKTVLLNFLCAQAQKFGTRLFFFDKDHGAEPFIRALGGIYTVLGGGSVSGFNPLQLPDSPENRAFLIDWLRALVTHNDETITSADEQRIAEAIHNAFKLHVEDRTLSKIAPFLGVPRPGSLAGRLQSWHSQGHRAHLFGNAKDTLSLERRVMGFEMGAFLEDQAAAGPTLLYLFHRIAMVLDGTRTMIVLDEAWHLIDNSIFGPKIKDWLKTLRKLNAFVVFATQSPEDASKSPISDTLVQQCATHIFLPNERATATYQSVFKLTEREFKLVGAMRASSRKFLIKRGRESVIAWLDLGGLQPLVKVLSGRAETVHELDLLRAAHGDDPRGWLPIFMEVPYEELYPTK